MDSTKIKDWLEIVGIFGVIASLIFVGMEMRQSQQIAIATINSQRTDTTVQFLTTMATNPALLSLYDQALSGEFESWTSTERLSFNMMFGANMTKYADTYWQYVNGFVPEYRWLAVRENLKRDLSTVPPARALVQSDTAKFSEGMQQVIDELLAEIDAGK
jgi:hypothetical protein